MSAANPRAELLLTRAGFVHALVTALTRQPDSASSLRTWLASMTAKVVAVIASVAIAVLVWQVVDPTGAPRPERVVTVASPTSTEEEPAEVDAPPAGARSRPANEAAGRTPEAAPVAAADASEGEALVHLEARFVDPRRGELTLEGASIEVFDSGGTHRMLAVNGSTQVVFSKLPAGVYTLRAHAPGVRHQDQVFDLSEPRQAQTSRPGEVPTFTERVVLWPPGWVQIAVLTTDGRSVRKLAEERGYEPRRLFVGTFDVRTQLEAAGSNDWPEPDPDAPADFEVAPGYQGWILPGNVVGSLRLAQDPPMWVGLAAFGTPVEWQHLKPGQDRLVFRIDQATLDARFSRLRVRAVDAGGGGLADATATLKADTSAHRRDDQADVTPDAQGSFEFTAVVPGRYELTIQSGEALHQQRVDIAPLADLDLGDVVLAGGLGIDLEVRDLEGNPVLAWIELAPFAAGGDVRELYPPNLHRMSKPDGTFRLPMPSQPSIVRATLAGGPPMQPTADASINVLIDPENPPLRAVSLVVIGAEPVRFTVGAEEAREVRVLDGLGLVVGRAECAEDETPGVELVPGSYRAQTVDEGGSVLDEQDFVLGLEPLSLSFP